MDQGLFYSPGPPTSSAIETQPDVILLLDEIGSQICSLQFQCTEFPKAGRKAQHKIIHCLETERDREYCSIRWPFDYLLLIPLCTFPFQCMYYQKCSRFLLNTEHSVLIRMQDLMSIVMFCIWQSLIKYIWSRFLLWYIKDIKGSVDLSSHRACQGYVILWIQYSNTP